MKLPHALRALRARDYRLFFGGQGLSLVGNWMTSTANAWLAYELSHSAAVVGLVFFMGQIPVLLFASAAGVWGDRVDRRRLFFWLQVACLLYSAALAGVTFAGLLTVPVLLGLALFRGLINSVEFPTRQALIVDFLGRREDLPGAIALNSSMFNVARLLGPMIAGAVIATAGPGVCYAMDAATCLPILFILPLMSARPARPAPARRPHPLADLREGLRHATENPRLRRPLLMVASLALCGFSSTTLAPVYARDLLGGDARTLGAMHAAIGAGALLSALFLGAQASAAGLPRLIRIGAWCVVVGHVVVAASSRLSLTLGGLMVCGAGTVLVMAGCNTLIQSRVDDDKRGRVMGLFAMGQGMFPIGSLLIGILAEHTGARVATLTAAVALVVTTVVFAPRGRPAPPALHG